MPAPTPPPGLSRRAFLVLSGAAAATTLAACSTAGSSTSSGTSTFTLAAFPTGNTLDPWKTQISQYAEAAVYDTLTHLDADGTVVPWLATSWSFTDAHTLVLKLRSGVTFSDGTAFNAAAVKANLEYGMSATPANVSATPMLATISSVEATAEDVATVRLSTPNPDLPYGFSQMAGWMVSPKALENPASLAASPVGSGPYLLDASKSTANVSYTFTKNPHYWAADQWPRFETLVVKLIGDPTASDNAARSGEIDFEIADSTTSIPGWRIVNGSAVAFQGLTFFDLDGKISKPLADVRVRQAMNLAIDRGAILKNVLNGAGVESASTPFGPTSPGWSSSLLDIYPYDPAKAKSLLAEAGYAHGFSLDVLSNPNWDKLAQAIAGYLRAVGVEVTLSDHTTDLVQQTNSGNWAAGITLQGVYGLPYTDVRSTMTPASSENPLKNNDATIDKLLEQAALATDTAAQDAIYTQLARYAAEQAWFVMPALTSQQHAYNPGVVQVTEPKRAGAPMLYHMVPAGG